VITVLAGGTEVVLSGGVATNITLAGGQETVSSGATAEGIFKFIGSGGRLVIDSGAAFTALISGFGAGDSFNLASIAFSRATITYRGSELSVTDGAHSVSLNLLGQYMAAGFQDSSNGSGGTIITYTSSRTQSETPLIAPGH
jgi:autotransporter passenger strand-loop-strand repeat protein